MKITAVIMAGGKGERFWPKSRINLPKQFLSLTSDGKTMIQHTVERLLSLVCVEDIFIATNELYVDLVKDQVPGIPTENILTEPVGRNTAPCIGFAAAVINKKYDDAVMMVLPSDHLIKYKDIYLETLKLAVKTAKKDENLVTIGITPSYPETGYGYICCGDGSSEVFAVEKFVEKPNLEKAKEYLVSGKYLWNSGMFVWKVSSIMKNYQEFLPDIYAGLLEISETLGKENFTKVLHSNFKNFESISIDYGIMEKAKNIFAIPGNFGWDDVGSWLALERINKKNEDENVVLARDFVSIDTKNCVISADKKTIATIGIKDLIIVDTDDAMLICNKNSTQKVKDIISKIKEQGKNHLL